MEDRQTKQCYSVSQFPKVHLTKCREKGYVITPNPVRNFGDYSKTIFKLVR